MDLEDFFWSKDTKLPKIELHWNSIIQISVNLHHCSEHYYGQSEYEACPRNTGSIGGHQVDMFRHLLLYSILIC